MTDLPAPLVPADCDLTDFDRMPIDIKSLRGSKFDAGLDDTAWRAGVNLWISAWHGAPAASLDDDDEALAVAAGLRDLKKWARIKAKALRGFVRCADGRLYHDTLAELVLEAWLEKLFQRLSSGAGNAKRWGAKFDPETVWADIETACEHLEQLNPDSKALAKARRKSAKRNPDSNPGGTEKPPGETSQRDSRRENVPRGEKSQENRTEENGRDNTNLPPPEPEAAPAPPRGGGPAAPIAAAKVSLDEWLNTRLPLVREKVSNLDLASPGTNQITALRALCEPNDPADAVDWDLDLLPALIAVGASIGTKTRPIRSFKHPAIADMAFANRELRLNPKKPEQHNGRGQTQRGANGALSRPEPHGAAGAFARAKARGAAQPGQPADDLGGDRDESVTEPG